MSGVKGKYSIMNNINLMSDNWSDNEKKKWSKLVQGNSDLTERQAWPSLGEASAKNKEQTILSMQYVDMFKKPQHKKKSVASSNTKVASPSKNENLYVCKTNTSTKNSKTDDNDCGPWQIVQQKKHRNSQAKQQAQKDQNVPLKETPKKKIDKDKNKELDGHTENEEEAKERIRQSKELRKQVAAEEKKRRRQERLLKERVDSRKDTKVNLISRSAIEALKKLSSAPHTIKTQESPSASNYNFQSTAEYPSLKLNHENYLQNEDLAAPIESNVAVPIEGNFTMSVPVKRNSIEVVSSLHDKNVFVNRNKLDPNSYSAMATAALLNHLSPSKNKSPSNGNQNLPNHPIKVSPKNLKTKDPMEVFLFSYINSKTLKNNEKILKKEEQVSAKSAKQLAKNKASKLLLVSKKFKSVPTVLHRGKKSESKKKARSKLNKDFTKFKQRRIDEFVKILQAFKQEYEKSLMEVKEENENNLTEIKEENENNLTEVNQENENNQAEAKKETEEIDANDLVPQKKEIKLELSEFNSSSDDKENVDASDNKVNIDTSNSDAKENDDASRTINPVSPVSSHDDNLNDFTRQACSELTKEIMELQNPLHNRYFRSYCNHVLTPEIDAVLKEFLEALVRFQNKALAKAPNSGKKKRRFFCGLKEALKHIPRLRCIIISPDIQPEKGKASLDFQVQNILDLAAEKGIPIVFGLNKRKLAKVLAIKHSVVSCIAIVNYEGADELFIRMMALVTAAKKKYRALLAQNGLPCPDEDGNEHEDEFTDSQFLSNRLRSS